MPKIYILLPVHNRKEITRGLINCLTVQTFADYHLVLIDDGSSDGTADMVKALVDSSKLTVISGNGDWWWAGSLQKSLDWLNCNPSSDDDMILIINDDVEIPAYFLEIGCRTLTKMNKTLLQATIYDHRTKQIIDTGVIFNAKALTFENAQQNQAVNCLTTNGLFLYRKDLKDLGGFYPNILPHYLSDYEFTIRAAQKGFTLKVSSELKLYWNRETTGYHEINKTRLSIFLKRYFSKKSAGNPVYWTTFILLVCPIKYIPWNLSKIWYRALKTLIFQLRPRLT